jgi:uncharacterized repeat protein (TIGR03806 family)
MYGDRKPSRILGLLALASAIGGCAGAAAEDATVGSGAYGLDARPVNAACHAWNKDAQAPTSLSATGCFDPANVARPAAGLVPFDVNAPLWADGAHKQRWLAVPDDAAIAVASDGDFEIPAGSILIKTLSLGETRVETRLLVYHPEGGVTGYAYEWNAAQSDAQLLNAGKHVENVGPDHQAWDIPGPGDCLTCHTQDAGFSLGLEMAQLNRDFTYPNGRTANQLATLADVGLLLPDTRLDAPAAQPALPAYDGGAPLEDRARSYLQANCSSCHRAAEGVCTGDLRFGTPLAQTGVCNVNAKFGYPSWPAQTQLLVPGDASRSAISLRMHAARAPDAMRMPALGSAQVDPLGTELIDAWIASLRGCDTK